MEIWNPAADKYFNIVFSGKKKRPGPRRQCHIYTIECMVALENLKWFSKEE